MADFITDTQLNGYKDAINKKISAKYDGMRSAFAAFDTDGDGKISRKEIARALAGFRLNISRNHLEQVFELADSNGDGGIDYDEFVQMLRKFDVNDAMSRFMSTLEGGDGLPRLAPTPPPGGRPASRSSGYSPRSPRLPPSGVSPLGRIYAGPDTRPESSGGRQPASSAGRGLLAETQRLNVENARLRERVAELTRLQGGGAMSARRAITPREGGARRNMLTRSPPSPTPSSSTARATWSRTGRSTTTRSATGCERGRRRAMGSGRRTGPIETRERVCAADAPQRG